MISQSLTNRGIVTVIRLCVFGYAVKKIDSERIEFDKIEFG